MMDDANKEDEATNPTSEFRDRPVCAHYEPERQVFLLSRKRGKSLCNGGFGIVLQKVWPNNAAVVGSTTDKNEENNETVSKEPVENGNSAKSDTQQQGNNNGEPSTETDEPMETLVSNNDATQSKTTSEEYLRIEEVLFLHERGVLDATDEHNTPLDARHLYSYLNVVHMPLQVYLAYAHLRQQSFRVVRHCPERRRLILVMLEEEIRRKQQRTTTTNNGNDNNDNNKNEPTVEDNDDTNSKPSNESEAGENESKTPGEARRLSVCEQRKRELREVTARSKAPTLDELPCLAWDVYPPDQTFSRSAPGLPLFSVLVTSYSCATLPFPKILRYIHENHPIPIKIATVSDSGIVVLFGVSSDGIPNMNKQPAIPATK